MKQTRVEYIYHKSTCTIIAIIAIMSLLGIILFASVYQGALYSKTHIKTEKGININVNLSGQTREVNF